jgi:hypothetical protein
MAFDDISVPKSKKVELPQGVSIFDSTDKDLLKKLQESGLYTGIITGSTKKLHEAKLCGHHNTEELVTFGVPHKPEGYVSVDDIKNILETEIIPNKDIINELTNETVTLQGKDSLEGGRKFDYDKTLYSLMPPHFMKEFADVLTLGAKKYSRENWKKVPNAKVRYTDALLRHIYAYLQGEIKDEETSLHHLAHATCCISFLYELERLDLNP